MGELTGMPKDTRPDANQARCALGLVLVLALDAMTKSGLLTDDEALEINRAVVQEESK